VSRDSESDSSSGADDREPKERKKKSSNMLSKIKSACVLPMKKKRAERSKNIKKNNPN